MPGPFNLFNDRAKRVLALAQDEAIRMHHDHVGVEHLLLGLLREGEGLAGRTLERLGIELKATRDAVKAAAPPGPETATPPEMSLTPRLKKVFEIAVDESKRLGHAHVGTEHLLLALAREGESVATAVLTSFGVALDKVREETLSIISQPQAATGPHHPARTEPPSGFLDAEGRKRDWYCEDVLSGKLKVKILYEDERVLGFEHPYPTYQVHAVVIPKSHVASLLAPEAADGELLAAMLRAVQAVANALGLDQSGFRLEANAAAPGVTPHMHWHVAGPGIPPPERARWRAAKIEAIPSAAASHAAGGQGPFDRFDLTGKRVLALAQDEAVRLKHNYIGTEHLLAGILRETGGVGAQALDRLGVGLDKVRSALELIIGRGQDVTTPSEITLSPRAKKVIELAIHEARRLGHSAVGSGHLLLGLVREGEGMGSGILESLGIELSRVRHTVIELLGKRPPPPPPA